MSLPIPVEIRSSRIYRLLQLVIVMVSLSLIAQSYNTWQATRTSNNTNKVVHKIEDQTSPEAIAKQQEAINGIIVQLDCNQRKAFQDALNVLADQGILKPGGINVVTDNCNKE